MASKPHPAIQYANKVTSGEIVACNMVKLACKRFLNDIEHGHERGLKFDEKAADHAIKFFDFLHHIKGEWARPPAKQIKLELWQKFITANIFGWKKKAGSEWVRRFNTAYIEVARKNSKTTMAAGWAGYLFFADGEPGAEVYSVGTKKEQAQISFDTFKGMVRKSPELSSRIEVLRNNLSIEATNSKFEPVSSDDKTLDGLNIHGAICDEVHEWKNRNLWDVIETATGSRQQPLQIAITTSGTDRESICYEQHEYVEKILKGLIEDDSYFGIIYTIDTKEKTFNEDQEGDNWQDESVWIKANPNLGVSVKLDDLRRKAKKAAEIPAAQNNFLRKHMDVWTQQVDRWIDLSLWDDNNIRPIKEENLLKQSCFGGVDLSSVSDLTVWTMLFPSENNILDILIRVWCPESRLFDTRNRYRDSYQAWKKQGFLFTTAGDAIDYDFIRAQIVADSQKFEIDSISVDRLFQGYEFSMKLNDELGGSEKAPKVIACGMGYMSMAGPCLEMEKRLLNRQLNHGGNPILRFMADNVCVSIDPAGNKKPNKAESQGKIDGIIGILLGLDRILRTGDTESVYDSRGIEFL